MNAENFTSSDRIQNKQGFSHIYTEIQNGRDKISTQEFQNDPLLSLFIQEK